MPHNLQDQSIIHNECGVWEKKRRVIALKTQTPIYSSPLPHIKFWYAPFSNNPNYKTNLQFPIPIPSN
jgi:hypothetical protein